MKIGILGTGMVGRALAARLTGLGHTVVVGTRDVGHTLARTQADAKGTSPYSEWAAEHPEVELAGFPEVGERSELVINATAGAHTLAVIDAVGEKSLTGKVFLDLALPLTYPSGQPPHLSFANDDSLGEQVQRALPRTRVVKTLNTMAVAVMIHPAMLPGLHHVFVSGDDADAKFVVKEILGEFGWPEEAMIDLGGIQSARGSEMYANLLFLIAKATSTYDFNLSIVRRDH